MREPCVNNMRKDKRSKKALYYRRKNRRAQRRIWRKNMFRSLWPCLIIYLPFMLFLSFRVLEYEQAKHLVRTGEIQSKTEDCEEVTRHSVTAYGPYFYRIHFSDGTQLSTIYGANFDTTRNGYEELNEQLSQECTFRYVSVNILGIRKDFLISASNGEWNVGAEEEAVQQLGARVRLDMVIVAIMLVPLFI